MGYRGHNVSASGLPLSDNTVGIGGRTLQEALAECDAQTRAGIGNGQFVDRRTLFEALSELRPPEIHALVERERQFNAMATNMTVEDIRAWQRAHPEVMGNRPTTPRQ